MRKLFTFFLFVLPITIVFGQNSGMNNIPKSVVKAINECPDANAIEVIQRTNGPSQDQPKPQAVVWSEDFGGGWPAGWTRIDLSGICPWTWTDDGTWGYFNGNNGTSAAGPILSTTAANGWLNADNDSANHFTYGQPSGTTYQYLDTRFKTTAINCTGYPAIRLEFEQYFRFNNGVDMEVEVSNDNTNWTLYTVQGNTGDNTASANPDLVSIDISAVAGNQATVYLRIGWSARVYHWQIDDMRMITPPNNDIRVDMDYYNGFDDKTSSVQHYTQIPIVQAEFDTIIFGADFTNVGAAVQTNVVLDATVTNTGTFSGSSTPITLAVASQDSVDVTTFYIPTSGYGTYDIDLTVSADAVDTFPANNTETHSFDVTDTVYARDDDTPSGNWWYGAGTDYRIGNVFEIKVADASTSISYFVPSSTLAGTNIKLAIWDASENNVVELAASDFYSIDAADIDNWISLPFVSGTVLDGNNNAALTPGWYVAGLETQGMDAYFALSGTAPVSAPQTVLVDPQLAGTWFYNTQGHPQLRMNLYSLVCGTFNGSVTVFSDESNLGAGDGSITVIATGGTPPYAYNWSSGGNAATEGGLSAGTYTCTITDDNGCEKILIQVLIISGIDELSPAATVSIFPNPSNGVFTVEFTKAVGDDYNLGISNILGQEVYTEDLSIIGNFTKQLDLKSWEKGVYFLHVSNSAGEATYKIVIE